MMLQSLLYVALGVAFAVAFCETIEGRTPRL